tara:strand:- start:1202 stop:1462 length:261 start_codon:yes stop_codon:yes gene_type:complete
MDINQLINIIKKKINNNLKCDNIEVQDKSYLHAKHKNNDKNKFHIKLIIKSSELKEKTKLESTKIIYKVLDEEIKNYIHSIQILIH